VGSRDGALQKITGPARQAQSDSQMPGMMTDFFYDGFNQLQKVQWASGSRFVRIGYDGLDTPNLWYGRRRRLRE
jgi:hypothetical protein